MHTSRQMNTRLIWVAVYTMTCIIPLQAAIIHICNTTDTRLYTAVFSNHYLHIAIKELYPHESWIINSGYSSIDHITWQENGSTIARTNRYKRTISIPWFVIYAGTLYLHQDGRSSSTFFGTETAIGKPYYFWERSAHQEYDLPTT